MWRQKNDALVKEFSFPDFKSGLEFVNKIAVVAEKMNHHPDVELGYGRVKISLTTHHAGNKITDKDHALAEAIDTL